MADVRQLPKWAAGLAGSELTPVGDHWIADSPMGEVTVGSRRPTTSASSIMSSHCPPGSPWTIRCASLPPGTDAEVVFTVRKRSGMTDEEFENDVAAVQRDLRTLKQLLES